MIFGPILADLAPLYVNVAAILEMETRATWTTQVTNIAKNY